MRPSASVALLFMLALAFMNGEAKAESAGPVGQGDMTAQPAVVENTVESVENIADDTLANSTWIDMVTSDVTAGAIADVTTHVTAGASAGDADRQDKAAAINAANQGAINRDALNRDHAPSVNPPVMHLAASTMAVNFKTRDRGTFGITPPAAMRMPTALSLLTISLIVLALFEHRRRQP